MSDAVVRVGQATVAGVGDRSTTATAYGGFGSVHLLAVTDGNRTPGAPAAVAQAAANALLRAFRDDLATTHPRTRLRRAVLAALSAARRERREAGVTEPAQASPVEVSALVVAPTELWLARVGEGALWVVRGEVASPIESCTPDGAVPSENPDAAEGSEGLTLLHARVRLDTGDRLVLASGATALNLPRDVGVWARASSSQLAAQRLLAAAGAPRTDAAMAVQVLEVFEAARAPRAPDDWSGGARWRVWIRRLVRRKAAQDGALPELSDEELETIEAETIRALLETPDPSEAALVLKRHLRAVARSDGEPGLERAARCLVAQRSPHAVAVVAHLLASNPRRPLREFAVALLPRLTG
ncbi:MAG: hypothetical protein R3F39_16495 [Myxococcota bacterium]